MEGRKITKEEAIKRALASLPYHLEKYEECKYQSEHEGRRVDRDRALNSMFTHADAMKNDLTIHPDVYDVIQSGNPYQFEDFSRFAASDVPGYIDKLKEELAKGSAD